MCNAAVNPYFGPLEKIPDDAFDKIMASNIKSNLWLCNLALPGMAEKGGGSVVIVSSIGGLRGSAQLGAYGISKAADMQLTRSLAVEWSPRNVRINCVAPGLVKTDFARALWEDPERLKRTVSTAPLRRIGEPDEIGGVVAFLASKASSFMTGTVIVADGGVTIACDVTSSASSRRRSRTQASRHRAVNWVHGRRADMTSDRTRRTSSQSHHLQLTAKPGIVCESPA